MTEVATHILLSDTPNTAVFREQGTPPKMARSYGADRYELCNVAVSNKSELTAATRVVSISSRHVAKSMSKCRVAHELQV